MIEIKFQGNSMENLLRQISAFVEKIEVKETPKRGKHERDVQQPRPCFDEMKEPVVGYQHKENRSL